MLLTLLLPIVLYVASDLVVPPLHEERHVDFSGGDLLRILTLVTLLAGVSSRRPAVQAAQALVLLAVGMAGAALISVKLM